MPALIFYDKRVFTSSSSTSAAAGFPSSNAIRESLARPWKATSAGAEEWVGNFAVPTAVDTFCLHDVNFASATIQKSVSGGAFVGVGTMTTYADRHGRRRGRISVAEANDTAIKVIPIGVPTDGGSAWYIGAAYPWGSQLAVPVSLIFPVSEEVTDPAVSSNLVQDLVTEAATGQPRWSTIQTNWQRKSSASLGTLMQKSLTTIWFDCNTSDYPEQQWPVYRRRSDKIQEVYDRFQVSRPSITLRERVL
jgi:hypothetical protein